MVSTVAVIVASGLILNVNVVSGLLVESPDEVLAAVLLGPSHMGGAGYYLAEGIIYNHFQSHCYLVSYVVKGTQHICGSTKKSLH